MNNQSTSAATMDASFDKNSGEAAGQTLLLVDDDKPFLDRLARAMEARGFIVAACSSVAEGLESIAREAPAFAVVDMRLGDGNGLDVISELKAKRPGCPRHHPDRLRQHHDGGHRSEARRL